MSDEVTNESQQEPQEESQQEAPRMALPPASFLFLTLSLRAQCEIQLGLMHYGEGDKAEPDLELARHTIDLMGVLHEKTKANLTSEEHLTSENSLTHLLFRFLQTAHALSKP